MERKTEFPRSITLEDIDKAMTEWVQKKELIISNRVVPIIFITPEKWAEFEKMWTVMDEDKNVQFPIIVVKRGNISPNSDRRYRVRNKTFITYTKPEYTNNGLVYVLYTVPQPIKIDINYEFRKFFISFKRMSRIMSIEVLNQIIF